MIREALARLYNDAGTAVIAAQDVAVPGSVIGVVGEWRLVDEQLYVALLCHDRSVNGTHRTVGLYLVGTDQPMPARLDLALAYGPQAAYLGTIRGTHVFVGPAQGDQVGL